MKVWKEAELIELNIAETAYGKNPNAKEANANKNPNNGAGSQNNNSIIGELGKESDVTPDTLS